MVRFVATRAAHLTRNTQPGFNRYRLLLAAEHDENVVLSGDFDCRIGLSSIHEDVTIGDATLG